VEYEPARQERQELFAVAPIVEEYFPSSHGVHVSFALAPLDDEYVAAAHSKHVAELPALTVLENFPALHSEQVVFPARAYFPARQDKHTTLELAPDTVANDPASQFLQSLDLLSPQTLE
jgi:hypothetical protein